MLWVEQPVGTGFLIGEVRATSQEDVAADLYVRFYLLNIWSFSYNFGLILRDADSLPVFASLGFFANFQKIFGIKNFKIYVTGESYAGRYVPYIASATLNKNDTEHFKVFSNSTLPLQGRVLLI